MVADKVGESSAKSSKESTNERGDSGSYPPPSTSLAFPEDPFSEPYRRSPAEEINRRDNPESLTDWARSTRFTVLNHFSHVTNVARNGAHTLLSSPLFQQQLDTASDDGQPRTSGTSLATSLLQHGPVGPFGPNDPNWRHSDLVEKSGTGDFDSAHVYLARWAKIVAEEGEANRKREAEARRALHRAAMDVEESELGTFEIWDRLPHIERPEPTRSRENALSHEAWKSLFDQQGRPCIPYAQMKALIFQQGFGKGKERQRIGVHWDQMNVRAEAWSFLLGAQSWNEEEGRDEQRRKWNEKAEEYWAIKTEYLPRIKPDLASKDVKDGVEECGDAMLSEDEEVDAAFWKEQRHRVHVDCMRVDRKLPFFSDIMSVEEEDASDSQGRQANAHIHRLEEILLSYVAWDRRRESQQAEETSGDSGDSKEQEKGQLGGYVQGMSDLCAPLYIVSYGDEAKTFWLFVGLMKRLRRNFYSDQSGMKMQLLCLQKLIAIMDGSLYAHLDKTDGLNLFFCFRWLLVFFKREFDFADTLMLWEAIWAAELDPADAEDRNLEKSSTRQTSLSDHFQIFVALSILEQQRDVVIKYLQHFDEILQYMNGLSGQIDVDVTIAEAQVFCLSLRKLIDVQDAEVKLGKGQKDGQSDSAPHVEVDDELRSLVGAKANASPSNEHT